MATTIPITTGRPLIDLETEVILGGSRYRKHVPLMCVPRRGSRCEPSDARLLLAINPERRLLPPRMPGLRHCVYRGDAYWFRFPSWLEPADSAVWASQSTSGALYLSRSDLCSHFGVSGVVLLQVLSAQPDAPCVTSRHFHRITREIFDPLDSGCQTQFHDNQRGWQAMRERLEVPPGLCHQLRREEPGFSVNLIQMYGPCRMLQGPHGPMLDMSDHIYA